MSKCSLLLKKHYIFLLLVPVLIYIEFELLKPHLKFGFSDVDWGFLVAYHRYKLLFPNIFENFFNTIQAGGIYAHQAYYIGIMSEFFGLNFEWYQLVSNIFKILSTILAYPLFYIVTKSRLSAIFGVILFIFSYPAVGTMYTTVTSSDYTAVLAAVIFLWLYFYEIRNNSRNRRLTIALTLFLLLTLFLSTERMYPLIVLIGCIELFVFIKEKQRASAFRIMLLFSPVVIILIKYPSMVLTFLTSNGFLLLQKIGEGNWNLILTPFISLGSLMMPYDSWRYFGLVQIDSLGQYLTFFLEGPLVFFIFLSLITSLIFKKPVNFLIQLLLLFISMGLLIYVLATHHISQTEPVLITPALIGGYILSFGLVTFIHWINYQKEDSLIGISLGIIGAFIFISITWLGADVYLIFTGVHRYLTMPALFISLSLGCLIALLTKRLWKSTKIVKPFSIIPPLILITISYLWAQQIRSFFQEELKYGFGAEDKQLMRNQLLNLIGGIDFKNPVLFYFDFSDDIENGYYYDNTILGGFSSWILWQHPKLQFKDKPALLVFWNDYKKLEDSEILQDGITGFKMKEGIYSSKNFYAFKLKNKKIYNITGEMLKK